MQERERMSEIEEAPRTYSAALLAAIAIAVLAAIGSLIWCFTLNTRLSAAQAELADAKQQDTQLAASLRETDARLKVATDELGKSVGLTQKELDERAQAIIAKQQDLESAEKQTAAQVSDVSNQVTTVKTDVGGVKTDLSKTQGDLATTISELQSVKGDLSSTNSVIARNHDELVLLEHKGDRNFYEFSLDKGQKKPVGTVSLELKRTDAKRNKFTIDIYADDKVYEKKDRNVNEPLQFYSGKDQALYEIVVNNINSRNEIAGYLSTPKGAPVPPTVQ
jgi:multidrug efflux pump subunit AcrA (membrane-fusion protein)